ncbi:zonular occludens toxin domain-containing protein [Pseudomonas sp. EA_65y_Pfl2_P78]|uniref:zonular occludens toxin domain-containing protein n=1 Tax=Pseudomonas sp. EA_65y_Pfl2_P78 TaxID=3088695 RepID=UPI0030D94FF7
MAIDAYVGKPGHGKSYGVVEHVVLPSLKQGRHVVTNIPLNDEELIRDFGGSIYQLPSDWYEHPDLSSLVPSGSVLILDEVWRRWPKGQKANQASLTDKALLAEHRHRVDEHQNSMRVVLVTQDLSQIAAWACTLIETTYRMKKLSKKVFRVDVYNGYVTGDSPPKSKLIRQTGGKFNAKVFAYYSSATQSTSGGVGDETTADGRSSIFRSWGLWSLLIIVVVGSIFSYMGLRSFFGGSPKVNEPAVVVQEQPKSLPKPFELPVSNDWRLVGFVHVARPDSNVRNQPNSVAVISHKSGRLRYISFSKCRYFDDFQEAYCLVDGSKITTWSSSSSNSLGSALIGDGVQRSANTVTN